MEVLDALALVALFVGLYGCLMMVGFVVDKLLRRFFGCGIWPEDYFKL